MTEDVATEPWSDAVSGTAIWRSSRCVQGIDSSLLFIVVAANVHLWFTFAFPCCSLSLVSVRVVCLVAELVVSVRRSEQCLWLQGRSWFSGCLVRCCLLLGWLPRGVVVVVEVLPTLALLVELVALEYLVDWWSVVQ